MIIEERVDESTVYHYSNTGRRLLQVETGIVYDEAYDIYPCPYTYEETDEYIDDGSEAAAQEKLDILLGEEEG